MANPNIPRPEYPRPDFERTEWLNLNGEWQFEFDDQNVGELQNWYSQYNFSRKIMVPFCFQSKLSGINDQAIHEVFWYKKDFNLPDQFMGKKVILNFGAVDYLAKVWMNGHYIGWHQGGHVPFKMDVSRFLKKDGNTIVLRVEDRNHCEQPRGKQSWTEKPDRCWYTTTSGIWQTVWLEIVGEIYIDNLKITPDIDRRNITTEIVLNEFVNPLEISTVVEYNGSLVKKVQVNIERRISKLIIGIPEPDYVDEIDYWTPETPNLYHISFRLLKNGQEMDFVKSYFGMRKISVKDDLILLNNKPYYQKLILDQGYWPESLLTPPSDDAILHDIKMTKKFGFNGARKHQKIEDPRYYYWADKLGLLVWGEMPSTYDFNSVAIEKVIEEWMDFIKRDYNHPCIITWVPLNESWGIRNILVDCQQQNFAGSLYHLTKALDGTRLISTNDGWEQVESDLCTIHDYEPSEFKFIAKYSKKENLLEGAAERRLLFAEGFKYQGQPILITEYGGIAFHSDNIENWGYYGTVTDKESFLKRFAGITQAIQSIDYICGYCYTQLTDVNQEINGLMDAHRKVKVAEEEIQKINLLR